MTILLNFVTLFLTGNFLTILHNFPILRKMVRPSTTYTGTLKVFNAVEPVKDPQRVRAGKKGFRRLKKKLVASSGKG